MIELLLTQKDIADTTCLLLDEDNIIPENDALVSFTTSDPVELRIFHEENIRESLSKKSQKSFIIVYKKKSPIIPYDFEKKHRILPVSFHTLFPYLDPEMLAGLSPESYGIIHEAHDSALTNQLSKEESGNFIIHTLFGVELHLVRDKEQLLAFLIDIHLSKKPLSAPLTDHLISRFAPTLFPESLFHDFLKEPQRLYQWIGEQLESFLNARLESDKTPEINFSHPSLSGKILHLVSINLIPKPELPENIFEKELTDEDRWILLLSPSINESEHPSAATTDPEIQKQITNLRKLAAIDQESFLVKTRKVMETVVNERISTISNNTSLPSLFEKLKYLEERNIIPKTTATLFHTIRKLGNLGAHESKAIHLPDSEIETILIMLSNILQWHKMN